MSYLPDQLAENLLLGTVQALRAAVEVVAFLIRESLSRFFRKGLCSLKEIQRSCKGPLINQEITLH
jgi:hypothetical protein